MQPCGRTPQTRTGAYRCLARRSLPHRAAPARLMPRPLGHSPSPQSTRRRSAHHPFHHKHGLPRSTCRSHACDLAAWQARAWSGRLPSTVDLDKAAPRRANWPAFPDATDGRCALLLLFIVPVCMPSAQVRALLRNFLSLRLPCTCVSASARQSRVQCRASDCQILFLLCQTVAYSNSFSLEARAPCWTGGLCLSGEMARRNH